MSLQDCAVVGNENVDPSLVIAGVTITGVTITSGDLKIPALQAVWSAVANNYVNKAEFQFGAADLSSGFTSSLALSDAMSWSDTRVIGGRDYTVRYRAVGTNAVGEWSAPQTVAVPAAFVSGGTTHVGEVPAGQVVADLETNAEQLALQQLTEQNFRSYQEALNFTPGGDSTQFVALEAMDKSTTAIQKLNILGALTSDGLAYVLNAATAIGSEGHTLASLLTLVTSTLGDGSVTVSQLLEAIDGQSGRIALAVNNNQQVVGLDLGVDGPTGHFDMVSPNFRFIDPDGIGGPLTVLSYSSVNNRWEMATDLYVKTLTADAVITPNVVDGAISDGLVFGATSSVAGTGAYVEMYANEFDLEYPARIRVDADVNVVDGGGNEPSYHQAKIKITINSTFVNANETSGVTATEMRRVSGWLDVPSGTTNILVEVMCKPDDHYDRRNAYVDWTYK